MNSMNFLSLPINNEIDLSLLLTAWWALSGIFMIRIGENVINGETKILRQIVQNQNEIFELDKKIYKAVTKKNYGK